MGPNEFIVLEMEDLASVITAQEGEMLRSLYERVAMERQIQGKDTSPNYLVVRTTAPYASIVRDLMRQHGDLE
ncbi:hypothetical protein [Bacillus phage SBSphiJ6]|nr:hypothetical protein [Bacillus phage SBSphiJ6]